jgi:imidazolonepropionase-like amidohydrolase
MTEGGRIKEIGDNLPAGNARVVDGSGKALLPGLRADLLLVNGHPDQDIKTTRNIDAVYKAGVKLDRKRR